MSRTGRPLVPRSVVLCTACGASIARRDSDIARNKTQRFFCGPECRNAAGAKPRRGREQSCIVCTVAFYVEPASRQETCSRECTDVWQKRHRSPRKCRNCGETFTGRPSADRHYCSRECYTSSRFLRATGDLHNGKPKVVDAHGYIRVWEPGHPNAYGKGWAMEHRLVAAATIGRPIEPDEHVHHINGIKTDNRPENLAVLGHGEHSVVTMTELWGEVAATRAELAAYREKYGPLA